MAETLDRRAIAEMLLTYEAEYADVFGQIADLKERLRKIAEAGVDGVDDLKAALRKLLKDDLDVDALKTELRKLGQPGHDGFTEEFGGGRLVKVSGGSIEKFKGIMPILDAAAFLELADKARDKLIGDKVVTMQRQFTEARRPSVTVKV